MTETPEVASPAPSVAADHPAAIVASDLHKSYGSVRALDGLSFSVEQGTIFALLGPNGAGKTTTAKILTTLSRPDSGSATVAGVDVLADPRTVRVRIGCVGQASGVDNEATGRENVLLQGRVHGLKGQDLSGRVDELLAQFNLTGAADRLARTYSGGMRRKLDLAMGLVHRPSVLFLDEPTAGLDPEARNDLWLEIERLSAEEGRTVLLTTHYLEEADRLAARVAIIDEGKLVVEGTPEELKSELRGDTLQVDLANTPADGAAPAALSRVEGLRDVVVEGRSVRARADSGSVAVPNVLAALEGAGLAVAAVTVARPSLDDVYLRHTGRTFNATDETEEAR